MELVKKNVRINRVSKVLSGGRTYSFSTITVVGDCNGRVGSGVGKSKDNRDSIRKGESIAQKKMQRIHITRKGTIPHPILVKFGGSKLKIFPAREGTGIKAGGPAKIIFEAAGIKNVIAKYIKRDSAYCSTMAAMEGLKRLADMGAIARRRSVSFDKILN